MESSKGMGHSNQKHTNIRDIFIMDSIMVKDNTLGLQETFMKEITHLDRKMGTEFIMETTDQNTKVIGSKAGDMDRGYKFIQMVRSKVLHLTWGPELIKRYDNIHIFM